MQCLNCEFENVPGMARCVRCHSALDLGGVAVLPPRATRWRVLTHWSRRWHVLITTVRSLWSSRPRWANMTRTEVSGVGVAWSFLPGLGLIKHGSQHWGYAVLGVWLMILMATVVTIGLPVSPVLLNAAIVVHVASVLWFLGGEFNFYRRSTVALFGLVAFGALRLFVYQPFIWFGQQFYSSVSFDNLVPGDVIANGDALLHEGPWLRPEQFSRGDIVLYDIDGFTENQFILRDGVGLDRIIGLPGEQVAIRDGQIQINWKPLDPKHYPLGSLNLPPGADPIVAGPDEYIIFPTRIQSFVHGAVAVGPPLAHISRVSAKNIRGRVVFRLHPWSRFGRLE
jgi:hypothetical protein